MGQTYLAEPDADGEESRTLRPLQAAAITYRIACFPRAGQKVLTLRVAIPREDRARHPLCADIDGFSLHAAVRVEAHDRTRLGQLCRYITRPALADERVPLSAAGQVELPLKTPWRDGATHLVMSPLEFMRGLAALLPRSRLNRDGRPDSGRLRSTLDGRPRKFSRTLRAAAMWPQAVSDPTNVACSSHCRRPGLVGGRLPTTLSCPSKTPKAARRPGLGAARFASRKLTFAATGDRSGTDGQGRATTPLPDKT